MSVDQETPRESRSGMNRRSLLLGAAAAGAIIALPDHASAAPGAGARAAGGSGSAVATRPVAAAPTGATGSPAGAPALPPVLRSRQAISGVRPLDATLPLTRNGTTYNLAQEVRWLDGEHFAIGRWDGTMSIFSFETAPYVGPTVTAAVNTPSAQGVQMITPMPCRTIATSNDGASLSLWTAPSTGWTGLRRVATVGYDPALGVATNGAWFPVGCPSTLAVGHDSGFLSLWSFDPAVRGLTFIKSLDLRNPNPVNPFGSHVMYGVCPLTPSGSDATVVAGSDDGYVSIVRVPSGVVLSQTVFNPAAQRGINSVSASGGKLLVANCSVGSDDDNLWYYSVDPATGALTLLDKMNLIIDTGRVQSFNFDTIWGRYAGGPCWFAGTEEGALWMGTADSTLHLIGNEPLDDGAIGAALDYTAGPGRLAAVIHNLNQFTTGAA